MTRRRTLGENMADWEAQKDQRDWRYAFEKAVADKDMQRIEELIVEGINNEYNFPFISDCDVCNLIKKHSKK